MKIAYLATAAVAAVVSAAPSFATVEIAVLSPSTISVPPTISFSPSVNTVAGDTAIYYEFTLGSVLTLSAGSFTNSALAGTGFAFSTVQLYLNTNPNNAPAPGAITPITANYGATGTLLATVNPYTSGQQMTQTLNKGQYTLVLNGTATGSSTVGSSITFAAPAVPEPATWGLMVLGFGAIGGALRTSRRKVVFA